MPKIKTSRMCYPTGWELIELTLCEVDAEMREDSAIPNIKTSRMQYPAGWELTELTLREVDAKMREGLRTPPIQSLIADFVQLRTTLTMASASPRGYGPPSRSRTRRADTYTISTTEGRILIRSCTSFVSSRACQGASEQRWWCRMQLFSCNSWALGSGSEMGQ